MILLSKHGPVGALSACFDSHCFVKRERLDNWCEKGILFLVLAILVAAKSSALAPFIYSLF